MRISDWSSDVCSSDLRTCKPSAAALRIWRDAKPLHASPAKVYLESRGILAASPALRFHPRTPLGPKGRTRFLPAMIAAVSLDERSEEHTSELQSLMRISYAVFCLKKKKKNIKLGQ